MKIKVGETFVDIRSYEGYSLTYYGSDFHIEGLFKFNLKNGRQTHYFYRKFRHLNNISITYILENWYLRKLQDFKAIPRTFII